MQAATKWSRQDNNEAGRPEIHRYPAAEAPCRPRLAPPATPPPPGASPPPRGLLQLPCATEFGLGQPMRQRHFSLNVEERVTTETRWDRTKFTRRSQTAEAPGNSSSARPPAPWPWEAAGPPPRGRRVPLCAAGSCLSPEPILWMCIRASTPTKLGTKLLESMFVTRPFSFAACLIGLWPKSTPPSIVSSLSQPCRYNKSNLLNPLNSLTQSAQTYSALMHHIDHRLQRKQIQNLSNVFKFYLLSGRLSGIHGKTLCEEPGERKWTSHHYSVRRQETCFAKVVRNAPGSKDGLLGKFPERTQTVIFFAAI